MKKKRGFLVIAFFLIIIIGIIFYLGHRNKAPKEITYKLSNLNIENQAYDITKYNNQIFVLNDHGIARYSEEGLTYIYNASLNFDTRFAVSDEYIIYTDNENKLFNIISIEGEKLESITWDEVKLEDVQLIMKIVERKGKLWGIIRKDDNTLNIIEIDLMNKTTNIILSESIYSFDFISDEKLAILLEKEEKFTINEYDLNTHESNKLLEIDDDIWNIKYDPNSNSIYYCGYIGLGKYSLDDKSNEQIIDNNCNNPEYNIYNVVVDDKIIVIANRKLCLLDKVVDSQINKLVILDNKDTNLNEIMPNMQAAINEKYNQGNILECKKKLMDNYNETLIKKLLARDTDFDLFRLDIGNIVNMDTNSIEHLEKDDRVQESLVNVFDGIKNNIIAKDDHIIGIPSDLYLVAWDINSEFHKDFKVSSELDKSWTWEEFLNEASRCKKYFSKTKNLDIWLTNWTGIDIINYVYETCNISNPIDKEEWRKLLITLKDAQDNNIIMTTQEKESITEHQYVLHDTLLTMYKSDEAEEQYILLPIVDKNNPIYFMCGNIYCINPYSKNKDLVIDLLCKSIEPKYYINTISSMIYSNKEWYTEYYNDIVDENRITLDDNAFDKYTYAINQARPISSNLEGTYVHNMLREYFEGNMGVDQVVDEICSYK